ncbi:diguanylate cyclase [Vibrio hannami]|uniref:sensor domain-containing diguanylate cyclase n=1 Tax=Vibrio hannami TaxID=2717094 RepID=UPI00240F2D4E|nr:diguanylate cyclase [Vibrio hannami]MDG3085797.1 diguanylate cyclase [Vibrio hannami]
MVFIVLLLSVVYLSEKGKVLDLALDNSLSLSQLHANLVSSEFHQYVTALKAVSSQSNVKQGDKEYIINELHRLVDLGGGSFRNAIYVDKKFNAIDLTGISLPVSDLPFVKNKSWYKSEYSITPGELGLFTKEKTVTLGVPIRNRNGEWQGWIAVSISLEHLTQQLSSITFGEGSYAFLSGVGGEVIAHPSRNLILNANIFAADEIGFPGFSAIGNKTRTNEVGYGEYYNEHSNESKIVTFAKVDYLPEWTLFVATDKSVIFKEIYSILMNVLGVSLVLMFIFLFVVINLTNRITSPIKQLTHVVRDSVDNRFTPIITVKSEDEIGQLSRAFSETINQVHKHTHNLEELVADRTHELNAAYQKLEEKNKALEEMASKDPLTELYNRRAFNVFAEKEMSRAARHDLPASLILIDIDHFKAVNDTYGHDVGDAVLSRIAHILTRYTRKENVICRWGGEEFIILLTQATPEMALCAMAKIRERISEQSFGPLESLTVSAGIASYQVGEPLKAWVHRADIALFEAKSAGRDCVRLAEQVVPIVAL